MSTDGLHIVHHNLIISYNVMGAMGLEESSVSTSSYHTFTIT